MTIGKKLAAVTALAVTAALAIPGTAQAGERQSSPGSTSNRAAATVPASTKGTVTPQHPVQYDGWFPTKGTCTAWGDLGLRNGWWDYWICVRNNHLPYGYLLFIHNQH
jgi:hypothetical protein